MAQGKFFLSKLSRCHVQNDSEIFEQMSGSFYTTSSIHAGGVIFYIIGLHIKGITREARDPADAGFVERRAENPYSAYFGIDPFISY